MDRRESQTSPLIRNRVDRQLPDLGDEKDVEQVVLGERFNSLVLVGEGEEEEQGLSSLLLT